jgi:hypothetical protein
MQRSDRTVCFEVEINGGRTLMGSVTAIAPTPSCGI